MLVYACMDDKSQRRVLLLLRHPSVVVNVTRHEGDSSDEVNREVYGEAYLQKRVA